MSSKDSMTSTECHVDHLAQEEPFKSPRNKRILWTKGTGLLVRWTSMGPLPQHAFSNPINWRLQNISTVQAVPHPCPNTEGNPNGQGWGTVFNGLMFGSHQFMGFENACRGNGPMLGQRTSSPVLLVHRILLSLVD